MNGGDGGTPASSPWRRLALAVDNAVELLRTGRLTEPYRTPFDVVHAEPVYKLRRYAPDPAAHGAASGTPLLLVPPLMVTSEVYDISPDLSAVAFLLRHGVDTWLVDFGPPERQQGGMDRTLDDHVRAVSDAVDRVRDALGRDVHLAGYSQGGMFVYQTAALRRSMGLASLVTFGSPVDIHRNVPGVADVVVDRVVGALRDLIERPLEHIDGLPGLLTSWGFRALSFRKELAQLGEFLRHLDDREALARREARRRFIRGEGFVAWPGPALRQFVDEFVVHNRMALGGFVLLGRTVTLADIRCPILCFVGLRDELARPAAVRAIRRAAPAAEVHEVDVPAGHFGLVVGRRAMERTWPTVVEWLGWREARGPIPAPLARPPRERRPEAIDDVVEAAFDDVRLDAALVADVASGALRAVGERLTDAVRRAGRRIDRLRWQLPRLRALASLEPSTRIGFSRALAEAARERPDATFFLWRGRAFRYRDANERVDNVARGLIACGVRPGDRVAVVMDARPSTLSVIGALLRVGAVAVLAGPSMRRLS
ncbi:MAG: AMP-binding protein, partial [Myxococcota bacterium]|nr:AMP-binding protein [Myxococcota bacterium]